MLDETIESAKCVECNDTCRHCAKYAQWIRAFAHPRWLTISPPISDCDPLDAYTWWKDNIIMTFAKFANNYISVCEFANQRMHFHIIHDQSDPVKEYIILNRLRKGGYKVEGAKKVFGKPVTLPCMVRIYKGFPQKGIHYIFKDIESTQDLVPNPIYVQKED